MSMLLKRRDILAGAAALALPLPKRQSSGPARAAEVTLSGVAYAPREYPIRAVPFAAVRLRDSFWQPRVARNAAVTIPFEFQKAADRGRRVNYNVLQAAIYSLQTHPDAALERLVERRVEEIRKERGAEPRRTNELFEVAAARHRATGARDLLDIAIRAAEAIYAEQRSSAPPFSGGERDAINCIELYRVTGDRRHLDLAKHYLDIRGLPDSVNRSRHNQSHLPVLQQAEAVGHAVNCASLMVSLVDVGVLTGLRDYFDAAQRMWLDAVSRKMYITGGIGSTGNEGFGAPHWLPNLSAYAETCAGIMFTTLNHKMFLATGDAQYIDVMERAMYNNVADGVSASGNRYFYVNRLASAGDGRDVRWEHASLECCPPNLARFIASMPGYVFAHDTAGAIYVNLYVASEASLVPGDGRSVSLSVESDMPWGGRSRITLSSAGGTRTLKLRVPGWCRNRPAPAGLYSYTGRAAWNVRLAVNGSPVPASIDDPGYVSLARQWKDGDVVEVEFPCETRRVVADDRVEANRGRVAVERGPIVYCAEAPDQDGAGTLAAWLSDDEPLTESREDVVGAGAMVIHGRARDVSRPSAAPRPLKLIPYCLWANRAPAEMSVWLRRVEYRLGEIGPAGGRIFYVNPNWEADGWRYLEAAPFDQSAGAPWGCFRTEIAGARGTAVGTGRRNTADVLAAGAATGTAAQLCASLRVNGIGGWFLPSIDELVQLYANVKATGAGDFGDPGRADNVNYWSSSQVSADMARHLDFADNGLRLHYDDKDFPRRVRAVRAF